VTGFDVTSDGVDVHAEFSKEPKTMADRMSATRPARSVLFAIGSPPKAGSMTATKPAKRPDTTTNTRVRAISSR